jgi:flagellar biosynthesis protein FliR
MEQDIRRFASNQYETPVMTVGQWLITMIIMAIPIVNIVMLFVWGFGNNDNPNRKTWAIAQLIIMAAAIVIWMLMFSTIVGLMSGMMGSLNT